MINKLESETSQNVTDVTSAAKTATIPENTADVDAPNQNVASTQNFQQKTEDTFAELKTENVKLRQSLSALTQEMRLMNSNNSNQTQTKAPNNTVLTNIRKYFAQQRGVKLKI